MTIIATAPVPAQCRLQSADTFTFPRLTSLSVSDAAELFNITGWEAFEAGARIRTEADVDAIAATFPPMTPAQIADLERWCAKVAGTPVHTIADWYGCSIILAEHVRDAIAGGAR